jgi:hypothetical protein
MNARQGLAIHIVTSCAVKLMAAYLSLEVPPRGEL